MSVAIRDDASRTNPVLSGTTIVALLNGLELFGNERDSIAIFEMLRTLGARVVVGVNAKSKGGAVAEDLRRRGFETFPLPFGNQWSWQWLKRYPMSVFEKLRETVMCSRVLNRQVRSLAATHVYVSSPLAYSFVAPTLLTNRVQLIYRAADLPPTRSRFNMRIWRAAMKRAWRIVCISRFVAEEINRTAGARFADRVTVIYATAGHSLPLSTSRGREERMVYVGQLTSHKGLPELIEAFSLLAGRHPNLFLDIVGGSPLFGKEFEEKLHAEVEARQLSDRVLFHGFLAHPGEIMGRALFQIVPTITPEPLGLVVLEAKMFQTPVVVFPTGGLPEMVRHKIDGYVCRATTVPALVEAIEMLLGERDRLDEMGQAAVADFQERFSARILQTQWAELFAKTPAVACS